MATPSVDYGFAFNGWLFGGLGQGVQILSVEGLEDAPDLRTQDTNRGYLDGSLTGRDFYNARTISMDLQIMNDANAPMSTYLDQLKQYLAPQQTGVSVLQFLLPNQDVRRVYARVRRRNITIDPEYTYGQSFARVEFYCPDASIYSDTEYTATMTVGLAQYRTYNRTYDLAYSSGTTNVPTVNGTNSGNTTSYPTITIQGPCVGPSVTNLATSQTLLFTNATLSATDTLVIDTNMRTITFNGVAARNLLSASSAWFGMASGVTPFQFQVLSGSGTATISYRDAYI